MVETATSNETTTATANDAAERDAALNQAVPSGSTVGLPILTTADGNSVVDLRQPPAADGAFVIIDGELAVRLADGTEHPLTGPAVEAVAGEGLLLQLGDALFFPAETVKAAVIAADLPQPLESLVDADTPDDAQAPIEPGAGEPGAGEAEAGDGTGPVSGGAPFRAFSIEAIGEILAPSMQLGAMSQGGDAGSAAPASRNGEAGGGSSFVNLRPEAVDDLVDGDEQSPVVIDPIANDVDPNRGDSVRIIDVDTTGLVGELSQLPDGSFAYDTKGRFQHLGEGETAEESFTYTITDPHGAKSTAKVTVTIHGVNDAPEAADDYVRTDEDAAKVHIFAIENDSDVDVNDTIRVVSVDTTGLAGTVTLNESGSLTYRSNGAFNHLGQGEKAYETFSYTMADQHGATSTATVTVRIDGRNDAPLAEDDHVVVSEKGEVRFNALANDSDPDLTDTIRVVSLHSLGNSQGQRWIDHEGTVTYRPFGAYDYLGQGEVAYQQFGYTIADQHGATSQATVTVKVVGVNDAPVAHDDQGVTDEDHAVVLDLLVNDTDKDVNDTHHIAGIDTTGLEGEVTLNADGTVTYDPNGQFEHLAVGETATETFRYTVLDQHGATSTATVDVLIHGVNDAPTTQPDLFQGYETVGFYAPIDALLANDSDIDGDAFGLVGVGYGVNGEVGLTPDGYVVFTPTPGYTGPAGFLYQIVDQHGATAIGEAYVDVAPITPGVMEHQTLSWFQAVGETEAQQLADGTTRLDMQIEVGAVAATALEIGGMPFFSATLSGILQGVISVTIGADGTPFATGALAGDLNLDVQVSPIFQPLGGDVFDALLLAGGGTGLIATPQGGAPGLPDLGLGNALGDLVGAAIDEIDLGGMQTLVESLGMGSSNAIAFGNGTFYLDIAGLITGAVTVPGANDDTPLVDADLFGQFAGAAAISIRDDLTVLSDGFAGGDFQAMVNPVGIGAGFAIGSVVTEEQPIAA